MGRPTVRIPSFLLRIVAHQELRRRVHYELRDLATGPVHQFRSLRSLQRFLAEQGPSLTCRDAESL
ncbi:MAG TPA: hypothetical protein PLA97_15835 [Rubrivivax sp.]|nr:hypothetical protein [Rubrivivax sp.]